MSISTLLNRWDGWRQRGQGTYRGPCVVCGTRSLKVSVRELDDGRVLMHAFCGHDAAEIIAALGLQMADLFPPSLDQQRYAPSRSALPAREALAILDHEVLVASMILRDILAEKRADADQWQRLNVASTRIAAARNWSCPARVPRAAAIGS